MNKMTDDQVRAELERIDPELAKCFDRTKIKYLPGVMYITAYRLLAESQQALGEIADMKMRVVTVVTLSTDGTGEEKEIEGYCDSCHKIKQIARTHHRGTK